MKLISSLIVTACIAAVAMIALMGGCGSDESPTTTVTVTTPAQQSHEADATASVTLPLSPLKDASGARGTVTAKADGHPRLELTIGVVGANRRYIVSLWTTKKAAHGLYAGYPGSNTQVLRLLPRELVHYRWISVVGQRFVRDRHGRRARVAYRTMLRISTNRLLNELLAR